MAYTCSLFQWGISAIVPFGDQLSGMSSKTPVSKRQEKTRIATAKKIKKAIKEERANPSLETSVNKMKMNAQKNLAESFYKDNQYIYDQLGKSASPLDAIIPGSGIISTIVARTGTANNLKQFAEESPSYKDTALKMSQAAVPVIIGALSPLWQPLVEPYITATVLGSTALVVVGVAITLDAVKYFRG